MAKNATQKNRDFAIKTALGEDDLLLLRATISEHLGRPFQIVAELLSEDPEINFDDVVGKTASIRVSRGGEELRQFHGYVSRFQQLEQENDFARYSLTLVPWLWFLTRTSDCRIFQEKTAIEIIEQVFKDNGFNDFKNSLAGDFPTREYCVQYRETAFNFVSRLMEEEGIYYFFEHEEDKHTLVLADAKSAHTPFGDYKEVEYMPQSEALGDRECITDWVMEKAVQPGVFAHADYNFKTPKTRLLSNSNISRKHAESEYEIFDYPGEHVDNSDGERAAKIRIEELQTSHETFHGRATARGLSSGSLFNLAGHARGDQNREYLIVGTEIQLDAGTYEAGQEGDTKRFLSCNLTAIDSSRPYRSQRSTPKPLVQGLQTAVVTGKSGEEIYPDKYGRVKVQFHWDREGKFDENSSCWIRVSQAWAGKTWGTIHIPHIGQEVIVEFLEGDPDRPIITGRVYNADQMPPEELAANKTKSIIRDRAKNEMIMDSAEGSEKIEIRDKYGNEIILDAVEGTIRIYSPTHESGIVLGKSIEEFSSSDLRIDIKGDKRFNLLGDYYTNVSGSSHENFVGLFSELFGGVKSEVVVGVENKTNIGAKFELIKGINVKVGKEKEYETLKELAVDVKEEVKWGSKSLLMQAKLAYEMEAKDISSMADSIEMHGEETIKALAKEVSWQADLVEIGGKMTIEGAKTKINSVLDVGKGLLKVKAPPGKSPKKPKKRKAKKSPEDKKKEKRKAARKARRKTQQRRG